MNSTTNVSSSGSASSDPAIKYGYQDSSDNFVCGFCEEVVKGVDCFRKHLAGFPTVTGCPRCPEHVQEVIESSMFNIQRNSRVRKRQVENYAGEDEDEESFDVPKGSNGSSGCLPRKKPRQIVPLDMYLTPNPHDAIKGKKVRKGGSQQTVKEACKKELWDDACRKIARWFYEAGIPFSAANHDSFKEMIEAIGELGPGAGMKPPSMYDLKFPLLNKEAKTIKKQIIEHKKEWVKKGCSILLDGWHDSVLQKDIINLVVNSPKGSVFLKSIDVSSVSKDADLLFRVFDKMIEEVGETNVVQVVTDNAAYAEAGKLLEAKRPNLYWTPCVTHSLDLMLEDIGKQIPRVKSALKKAIFSNGYIHTHVGLLNLMRKFTNQQNLHRPAITRFATSFITLAKLYKQKYNLRRMVVSQEWEDSKWSKEPHAKKMQYYFLQENFWRNIAYSLKLTGPLVKVFRMVNGDSAMGYMYKAINRAKEAICDSFPNREDDYKKAFEIIDQRWECQLHRPLYAAGHYLNPGIFYDDVDGVSREVKSGLYTCIERLVPDIEIQDKIIEELDKYETAEDFFGVKLAIKLRKTAAPVNWWGLFGISAPNLQNFAIRVLSLTCSATSCKRNRDVSEQLYSKRRNRLAQARVNKLVFVRFNLALNRLHKRKETDDPIRLQDIDDSNEWLMGRMEDDEDNNDMVFLGEDLAGKSVAVDEQEMEEDIGVSSDEEDELVLGIDDDLLEVYDDDY